MRYLVLLGVLLASQARGAAEGKFAPQLFGLIVAVSDYSDAALPDLPATAQDLQSMQQALLVRGARSDTLYLHGDEAGLLPPTRAAVLSSFNRLAQTVRPGDTVVVHFSGHGLQLTDLDRPAEADGLDEAFVFADYRFGQAEADRTQLLLDDTLDRELTALLETGANVLFLADFCHAGDSARNDGSIRAGQALSSAARAVDLPAGLQAGQGRFTAIFAAPSDRSALQSFGPVWADLDDQQTGSVLSMYASEALRSSETHSYRDLQTAILLGYSAHRQQLPGMSALLAPPRFEGISDAALPGNPVGESASRQLVYDKSGTGAALVGHVQLAYGALTGLQEGDVLDVILPGDGLSRPFLMGYLQVSSATATTAWAQPLSSPGGPVLERLDLHDESGRPVNYPARLILRQQTEARVSAADVSDAADVLSDLRAGRSIVFDSFGSRLILRQDGATLEIRPGARLEPMRLEMPESAAALVAVLAEASDFFALAGELGDLSMSATGPGDALQLSVQVAPVAGDGAGCPAPPGFFSGGHMVIVGHPTELGQVELSGCDAIWLDVHNPGEQLMDLTLLMVEPTGQIVPLPLEPRQVAGRLGPGQRVRTGYQFDPAARGYTAKLAVIVVEAPESALEIITFHHLCRPAIGRHDQVCPGDAQLLGRNIRRGEQGMAMMPRTSRVMLVDIRVMPDIEGDGGE